jgi:hypothetical protein
MTPKGWMSTYIPTYVHTYICTYVVVLQKQSMAVGLADTGVIIPTIRR